VTEQLQWGDYAVFRVGAGCFSVAATGPDPKYVCSFTCDADTVAELCERVGLTPAPYLTRAQWTAWRIAFGCCSEQVGREVLALTCAGHAASLVAEVL
jgi:predicted DNA-binding protein (MmcQ/YjbR family)